MRAVTTIRSSPDGMLAAIGPERSRLAYRMRAFLDAGAVLPGSTDSTVVHGAPLPSCTTW
ncbi:hypothetical protein GCM10017788_79960 [Amycolatopsis acidiphila]|nr:hypothetical protein GCM10017788_79960 [Amycolatopsis acidiphila]